MINDMIKSKNPKIHIGKLLYYSTKYNTQRNDYQVNYSKKKRYVRHMCGETRAKKNAKTYIIFITHYCRLVETQIET